MEFNDYELLKRDLETVKKFIQFVKERRYNGGLRDGEGYSLFNSDEEAIELFEDILRNDMYKSNSTKFTI